MDNDNINEIFKVWITKYALTQGILEDYVVVCHDTDKNMVKIAGGSWTDIFHGEGKEWHRTKESAIKCAEEMRLKKISSVEKQLQKLKDMKFE